MSERPTTDDVRREVSRHLQNYLAARAMDNLPEPFPPALTDAVEWWLAEFLEPEKRYERPRLMNTRSGDEWTYPFLDRCRYLLGKFLALDGSDRRAIDAAREEGIHWRGDSPDFLRRLYLERQRSAEMGAEAYVAECFDRMRALGRRQAKRNATLQAGATPGAKVGRE